MDFSSGRQRIPCSHTSYLLGPSGTLTAWGETNLQSKMRVIVAGTEPPLISQSMPMTVKCQDPRDGTGDLIVDLPPEILKQFDLDVGDQLSIEVIDGVIVLTRVREANPT
ncbi:AbrB/MazE/SpoVT family DNA-binding domain-containing protein [Pseudomonas sp. COR18]|uniref:AbrB/MazE/SpoVT family DNA-binding domain-containing protein n=1 Tax=Pseudomonas sp. COR18 TaxID=3399680 RepID=UPI003B00DAA3